LLEAQGRTVTEGIHHRTRATAVEPSAAITAEVVRRSPTQPPRADVDAPPLGTAVGFVTALLSAAGALAWLAAPLMGA
jgi:hypothetical protein